MSRLLALPAVVSLLAAPAGDGAVPAPAIERQALPDAAQTAPPRPRPANRRRARRPVTPPHLRAIAQCESHGNPRAVDPSGTYRGKYQFSVATWRGVGGSGDPARASEAEQDRRAAILYRRSGPGQWPVCGR